MTIARMRRILYATDFSLSSRRALREARGLARRAKDRLLLLHVMEPPSPFLGDELPGSYVELLAAARRAAERRLAAVVRRAGSDGIQVERVLAEGTAAEEILRKARRWRADAIVIGTHGRTGLARVLMG